VTTRRVRARAVSFSIRLLLLAGMCLLPRATSAEAVVKGKANPALDVAAVQAAVDAGGSVKLVGSFDFGDEGRVLLRRDVDISGEADDAGNPRTRIVGGDWTFFAPLPETMPPPRPGPKISVQRIHFVQPKGVAVHLPYCSGALVRGNKVTEIRRRPFTTFFKRSGVVIGPRDALVTSALVRGLVTGSIEVVGNTIDVGGSDPLTTSGSGVFVNMTDGAEVRVAENVVTGCTRNCLDLLDNGRDAQGRGKVTIERNTLTTDVAGIPLPTPLTPNGIVTGFNFNPPMMNDPAVVAPILVSNNDIRVHGEVHQGSRGIIVLARDAVVEGNTILVRSTKPGLGVGVQIRGANIKVSRNRITGAGQAAVIFDEATRGFSAAKDSTATDNDTAGFTAAEADYVLRPGSSGNAVAGKAAKVVDLGAGNRVIVSASGK
jgi:hypothetical protein